MSVLCWSYVGAHDQTTSSSPPVCAFQTYFPNSQGNRFPAQKCSEQTQITRKGKRPASRSHKSIPTRLAKCRWDLAGKMGGASILPAMLNNTPHRLAS